MMVKSCLIKLLGVELEGQPQTTSRGHALKAAGCRRASGLAIESHSVGVN